MLVMGLLLLTLLQFDLPGDDIIDPQYWSVSDSNSALIGQGNECDGADKSQTNPFHGLLAVCSLLCNEDNLQKD